MGVKVGVGVGLAAMAKCVGGGLCVWGRCCCVWGVGVVGREQSQLGAMCGCV